MIEKPDASYAPAYVALYPLLCHVARAHGYALCIHGSVSRDFDLVAVPWVDQAGSPEDLIVALATATGASQCPDRLGGPVPSQRSHGRLAWSLYLGKAYLDVSVMPRQEEAA